MIMNKLPLHMSTFIIILGLNMSIVGCGPGGLLGPTLTPTPTFTPTFTLTPTATPTPIMTPTPTHIPGCNSEEMNEIQDMISLGEPMQDRLMIADKLFEDESRSYLNGYQILIPAALAGALMSDGNSLKQTNVPLCASEAKAVLETCYNEALEAVDSLTVAFLPEDFWETHRAHLKQAHDACDEYLVILKRISSE